MAIVTMPRLRNSAQACAVRKVTASHYHSIRTRPPQVII